MDETAFRAFLENQQTTFSEFESLLEVPKTGVTILPNLLRKTPLASLDLSTDKPMQTRFDDACRCLAEAYIQCNDRQRAIIRKLMRELPVVSASMGIPSPQIQTKIDGARFRLALVYESIKDLRPDEKEAARRLERLRQAAMEAGFDSNPAVQEVAVMANDECHSGRKSMREVLLFLVIPYEGIPCPQCGCWYAAYLPTCPRCGASNPMFTAGVPSSIGESGETGSIFSENEMVRYLPTHLLIGYVALFFAAILMFMLTIQQITFTFQREGYHQTRGAWSTKAVILLLAVIVYHFRASLVQGAYQLGGRPRLAVGCTQAFC